MDPGTREPVKLIPCELCGSEAKLLCFCRKCSLCESCIGKHLINEPTLAHKPVTFSQSEIAAQYEREFTEIREHEERLIAEVSQRQEQMLAVRSALKLEIEKLEQFKDTCLEYVALAVEIISQKLALSAETIGKEMIEKCEMKKRDLEEALGALESGAENQISASLMQGLKPIFDYKIDLKDFEPEHLLRTGIEFSLDSMLSGTSESATPVHSKSNGEAGKPTPKRALARHSPISAIPASKAAGKTKLDLARPGQVFTKRGGKEEVKTNSKEGTRPSKATEVETDPSPGPPMMRYQTEVPSSVKSESGKNTRTSLLSQTALKVQEVSALVKNMKSPIDGDFGFNNSFSVRRQKSPTFRVTPDMEEMESLSPVVERRSGAVELLGEEQPDFTPRASLRFGTSIHPKSSNLPIPHFPSTPSSLPDEELKLSRNPSSASLESTPCLFSVSEQTTQMVIHDLVSQTSAVKTFDGIDSFLKFTFACVCGKEVYILGGVRDEALPSTIKKTCWIYSMVRDTIEQGPNLTIARFCCAAVCSKGSLYVSGGVGTELSAIKDCEKLDLRTRAWRRIGNLNVPRESHAMTEHLGRMYVAGGPSAKPLETYNPVNDRWALLPIKINAAGKASMLSAEDKLVLLHDKWLTIAWVDKKESKDVQELQERGWWTGSAPARLDESVYVLRGTLIYQYTLGSGEFKVETWGRRS